MVASRKHLLVNYDTRFEIEVGVVVFLTEGVLLRFAFVLLSGDVD